MFLFKGWQAVEKGTYLEPEEGIKIVLKKDGHLPGKRGQWYFKLPESYLLIPVLLLGLALSVALPYGIGLVFFACVYVLYKILFSLTSQCEKLFGDVFAALSIRYRPTVSFFSGSSKKPKCRKNREKGNEG